MSSWRDNVRKVEPYTPGEQPKEEGIIKLNTNENPYPPSPKAVEAASQMKNLRKYPDPAAAKLTEAIASYHGLSRDQVFVGVGSDDVLAVAFMTFFNSDKPIFFPDITYSFYPVWAELFRIPYEKKALDQEFKIRPEDYVGENGGVVFPNPNAPTGKGFGLNAVAEICENFGGIVLVDEAYAPFARETAIPLVKKYENLIVTGTSSKGWGLAGMRIGWAFAQPAIIEILDRVRDSYNLDRLAQAAGVAALRDAPYHLECVGKVIAERSATEKFFDSIGWKYIKSSSNFILFEPFRDGKKASVSEAPTG